MQFLAQFSDKPRYNTKAVAQETAVPADTFRAWERRYGVPQPQRTDGGHRLYSERDIALIRWLRDRTAEGLTISQAIALMEDGGVAVPPPAITESEPHSWERMVERLSEALNLFDAIRADQVLSEAFALYPLEDVFLKLVQPMLVEVGEQWHSGKVTVVHEHFATEFIRRKLYGLFSVYQINEGRGLVMIGCAPNEQHDLGALMLAVFLVRHGWQVLYLGTNIPPKDLLETVRHVQPDIVCMAAASTETASYLAEVGTSILALPEPAPVFGYGGRAYLNDPQLIARMPGVFLGRNAREALYRIAEILENR